MQLHGAFSLSYPSAALSLQSTVVYSIRVSISEVKLCTSVLLTPCVQRYYFDDLSWRGAAPQNNQPISKTKKGPLSAPYACARSVIDRLHKLHG
ncbi:hypothetical protein EVAR_15059_1 [Eumeta japonica]|uniref:Uncharacterized protein n=1 Tax=Eumeta variegata TaxID=151549 RepID=A0A4C1YL57_EUMVA|nr:hypothetical protein EVAR_15059_1 [Eumeta japonica]